jgi:hypothetical protein
MAFPRAKIPDLAKEKQRKHTALGRGNPAVVTRNSPENAYSVRNLNLLAELDFWI